MRDLTVISRHQWVYYRDKVELESEGELDNTLLVFLSDNGPEGHDLDETWPMEAFPKIRQTIDAVHDFSYEAMGRPGSYVLQGPNWANAGSPGFRLHKAFPTEGGTRVTAFVRYPKTVSEPAISNHYIFATDVTPTVLEIAGVKHPYNQYQGRKIESPSGKSFVSLLEGKTANEDKRVVALELLGKRMVRKGQWKLVHMPPPYGTGAWQLFNLNDDLAESADISEQHPEMTKYLENEWRKYAEENGVILPDWVSGY